MNSKLALLSLINLFNGFLCHYLNANNGSSGFFEGDIKIHPNMYPVVEDKNLQHAAIRGAKYRWTKATVPYKFNDSIRDLFRERIERAMKVFQNKTCVKFVRWHNETDYIEITDDRGLCYSNVGRTGGKQVLSLSPNCTEKNVILHELMHALGFYHEHSRYDRDKFIEVDFGKVESLGLKRSDFEIKDNSTATVHNTMYDFNSVMHYPATLNGHQIIKPRYFGVKIKARGLSRIDIYEINQHYRCDPYESSENEADFFIINTAVQPQITKCSDGKFYCGHELEKMKYKNISNKNGVYRCNDKMEGVLYLNCTSPCLQTNHSAHCSCGNKTTRPFCGYELKLFNMFLPDIENHQPYICQNMSFEKWGSKCPNVCRHGTCREHMGNICIDGTTYCGRQLVHYGLYQLGDVATANVLYKCNGTESAYEVENCKQGCIHAFNSYCSTDYSQVTVPSS
jgi:hypothetical protein